MDIGMDCTWEIAPGIVCKHENEIARDETNGKKFMFFARQQHLGFGSGVIRGEMMVSRAVGSCSRVWTRRDELEL
jgi:hypothetical protein